MTDREHIEQLAAGLGLTLHWTAEEFRAAVNHGTLDAYLEPLRGDEDDDRYATALHELGHIAAEQTVTDVLSFFLRTPADRVADEALAWRWAIQTARRELTEEFRTAVAAGMGSYFLHSGIFPDGPHTDVVREVLEAAGDVSFPQWPKTNDAYQRAREAYLGVAA